MEIRVGTREAKSSLGDCLMKVAQGNVVRVVSKGGQDAGALKYILRARENTDDIVGEKSLCQLRGLLNKAAQELGSKGAEQKAWLVRQPVQGDNPDIVVVYE